MTNSKVYVLETICDAMFYDDDVRIFSTREKAQKAGEDFITSTDYSLSPRYYINEIVVE